MQEYDGRGCMRRMGHNLGLRRRMMGEHSPWEDDEGCKSLYLNC